MAKKVAYDLKSIKYLEGRAFAPLPLDLLESDAWRGMSVNCWRLVTRLMAEHMAHAGQMNGHLIVSYDQLVEWGIGRRLVAGAIREGEQRGLVRVRRGGKRNQVTDHLSRYTLTFYPILRMPPGENAYHVWPSDEWKRYRDPKLKNRVQVHEGEPGSDHLSTSIGSPSCTEPATEAKVSAVPAQEPSVHEGEHPIISWRDGGKDEAQATTSAPTDQPVEPIAETAGRQPDPVEPAKPILVKPHSDDDGQLDLEAAIAARGGEDLRPEPIDLDELRDDMVAWLDDLAAHGLKRGGVTSLSHSTGISRVHLSNFKSARESLSPENARKLKAALAARPFERRDDAA